MSDILDRDGLQLKTLSEIRAELSAAYRSIYGEDINIDPDTPDGQAINIYAQASVDLRELLADIYAGFDPDQAAGRVLDQRVALNGIQRKGATFTKTPISITVDRSLTLTGMDGASESLDIPSGVFTVKDDAGTQFVLLTTVSLSAGTHSLLFRAAQIGAVLVSIGTITTAVTATAGVTAITNSTSITVQGVDEESDGALKVRRERSINGSAQGYTDSIEAEILSLDGVTACICEENATGITDANGTPPHSIWVIVEGGDSQEIANAIYAKRSAGCGMRGDEVVPVARTNGRTIDMSFDRAGTEDLYARFNLELIDGGTLDTDNLKTLIVENVLFNIGAEASGDQITCYLKTLNPKYRITGMQLSADDATWLEVVDVASVQNKFVLDTSRITIS